uniref:NAD(P)-binding domain-containing protein n=1 Tax=Chromulina nebulosa TaxID=96789 RepID=A0A7S0SZP8_9STRA|mmetsp:Transcript_862/g.752  ORF Transcript_862/g.752 Transcript_862/m.752 type:complete len:363 (+) Transcript_862:32-1120(+)
MSIKDYALEENVFIRSNDDFTPQNILITGGAGFIASHVVFLLVKKYPQFKIVNLDRLDYCSCLENLDSIKDYPNYKFIKGNICSSDLINFVLSSEKIDTILHFAAQTHVDNSFGNSFQFTQNNIMGTHVLLESAKLANIKRFIHVSTDEVYGEQLPNQDAMLEEQVLEPTNPYAATKAGAEFLVKSYHRSFGLPVIITRGNNVYGPHQYPEKMVPKFINQLMRGRKVTLHGNGMNKRNFLYVEDVARAFEIILFKGIVGMIYNIGGSYERTNIDVARSLIKLAGFSNEDEMMTFVEDRIFNDFRYHINSSKLIELGWKEQISWEIGLQRTFDWYSKYSSRFGDIENALVAHPRAGLDKGVNA